jgi:MtN3 and saliva related transmembrane protein
MELAIFGYIAAFCTAISFLPQAIKTIRTREVRGLSMLTYLFLFLGSISWLIYGVYQSDLPLIVTNTLTTIFSGIILFFILRERNKTYN